MPVSKFINFSQLVVNPENLRFEPVSDQKQAINLMIENQKDDLLVLAEDIINFGFSPDEKMMVMKLDQSSRKYIVFDGNRRTVTIKLLNNPDLIEGSSNANLKKKFKKLATENKNKIPSKVECSIYDSNEIPLAEHFLSLKHGYGKPGAIANRWEAIQKQRYDEKTTGKTSTALQIIKMVKTSPSIFDKGVVSKLNDIKVTNLSRLIDDPQVRDFLGLELNNGILQSNIEKAEVSKGLNKMLTDLTNPKFTVKDIYLQKNRTDYLKTFPKDKIPNKKKLADKIWQFTSPTFEKLVDAPINKPSKSKEEKRTTVIPKSCPIEISNSKFPKLAKIYKELQTLDVYTFNNSASTLFRVFLELSLDCYLETNKLIISPVENQSAQKSQHRLPKKINMTANHMEQKNYMDSSYSKAVRNIANYTNGTMTVDTFHHYIHSVILQAKSDDLIMDWNNIEKFMVILWSKIK